MNNKKVILNPILRIWLAIFAIIIFISVLSAFNGERWHFNKTVDYFKAATGDVTTHELYTPAKIFFALIFSFAPPLLWLLVVNKRKLMAVTHGVIPLIFFLLSIVFSFSNRKLFPVGKRQLTAMERIVFITKKFAGKKCPLIITSALNPNTRHFLNTKTQEAIASRRI